MNRLDIFSQNLRRECARFESIALVCRLAKINRQQFSKYLAGKSLPSAAVLRKICATLSVQENTLFTPPLPQNGQAEPGVSLLTLGKLMKDFGNAASGINIQNADFPPGNYFCYILIAHLPGMVIRTFVQVKKIDWCVSFTRITVLASESKSSRPIGRHKGVVLSNPSGYYFLGINRYTPNQISFMAVERKNGMKDTHFSGIIVTHSGPKTVAEKFCLVPMSPKMNMRDMKKSLGLLRDSELDAEAFVLISLKS